MELKILKHFINKDVEILIGGVWIEGHLTPISEGLITLMPLPEASAFYGPAAMKAENVQCIRQVKREMAQPINPMPAPENPSAPKSAFESAHPGKRFVIDGGR